MSRAVGVLVCSVVVALAGCGAEDPAPQPAPPKTTTTTSEAPKPKTLADYQKDPCAILSDEDKSALGVVAGGDAPVPYDKTICSWVAGPGIVQFQAFPTADRVPEFAAKPGAVPLTVSGHAATQIVVETSCFTHVTVAPNQSFRISATGDAAEPCPATVEFATVVLRNLG